MKKLIRSLILTAATVTLAVSSYSQTITISSGITGGTNHTLVKELTGTCTKNLKLENLEAKDGSPQSITRIANNQATAGIIQADVLKLKSKDQDLNNIKVLFPLHSEQVHILAAKTSGIKEGGTLGFNKKERVLNDWADLQGTTIGASGGSLYTAQVLQALSGITVDIDADIGDTNTLIAAVRERKIAAAVFVGGAPMKAIAALNRNEFKLLTMSNELRAAGVKYAYRNKTIAYENLGTAGIPTLEVDALFAVYNFSGKKMVEQLTNLRECFYENVADLSETAGTHPAWRSVPKDKSIRTNWPMYTPAVK